MRGLYLAFLLVSYLTQFPFVLSDEETSISFAYNGGKIISQSASVALLWFGDGWQESRRRVLLNAIASLTSNDIMASNSEVPTLRDWWRILEQYQDSSGRHVTSSVKQGPECFYTGPHLNVTLDRVVNIAKSVFSYASISSFAGNLSCSSPFVISDRTVYIIMFSEWTTFFDANEQIYLINSCSGNLGEFEVFHGEKVRMGWARAAAAQCMQIFDSRSYLGPPNGDENLDSLVSHTLAKIAEHVTNRDERGWSAVIDGVKFSASSVCAFIETGEEASPLFRDAELKASFNSVGLNGQKYMLQHVWDQQIQNCAMKLSEPCGAEATTLTEPKGYLRAGIAVNHTAGLQPYPPKERCQWKIRYSSAKFITFTLNYQSITYNDNLKICRKPTADCTIVQPYAENSLRKFKITGSTAYVEFTSAHHVTPQARGWELSYSAGFCDGKVDLYEKDGIISYRPPPGSSYVEGLSCQWVLHGKPGTSVLLSFTHINTSKDLDFIAIYRGAQQQNSGQVSNFSGLYSKLTLPRLSLTGEIMILFTTQTDQGTGWSANFLIAAPIARRKSSLLLSIQVSAAVLGGAVLVFFLLALVRLRTKLQSGSSTNETLKLFNVETLEEENPIGEGPSALIHKAILPDGTAVAVKAKKDLNASTNSEEEILLKASFHQDIVTLLGFAHGPSGERLLVFELMGRGSLCWNLRERGECLSWERRLEIALQVSSALQLLHMYFKPPICHGNLMSENVLLDAFWNAKLAGFGSSNYCMIDGQRSSEGHLEMEADIFNFGLLLIELLSGESQLERAQSPGFLEEMNENLGTNQGLDPRLELPEQDHRIMGLAKLGEVAKWCICDWRVGGNHTVPKVGEVVLGLKQVKQLFGNSGIS